jgi:hypothetical protein
MAAPSVTNAQGQVSVIQMQWSPEAGAKGTFDQADHSTDHSTDHRKIQDTLFSKSGPMEGMIQHL